MAKEIYKTDIIYLLDGTEVEISPLKIKYLKQFMDTFSLLKDVEDEDQTFSVLLECTRICMKQNYPKISESIQILEDSIDLKTMNKILDVCAGIKFDQKNEESVDTKKSQEKGQSWEELDLARLESEVFMIGKWKNFEELEESLCMAELSEIINSKRELDYEEKKFFAAIQGIDIEKNSGKGQKEWEDMKARVFSKGKATDSNDILALQGENARKAGFGIGMGLEYEDHTSS